MAFHWSNGQRTSTNNLPDVAAPEGQYKKLKEKDERAKNTYNKADL